MAARSTPSQGILEAIGGGAAQHRALGLEHQGRARLGGGGGLAAFALVVVAAAASEGEGAEQQGRTEQAAHGSDLAESDGRLHASVQT